MPAAPQPRATLWGALCPGRGLGRRPSLALCQRSDVRRSCPSGITAPQTPEALQGLCRVESASLCCFPGWSQSRKFCWPRRRHHLGRTWPPPCRLVPSPAFLSGFRSSPAPPQQTHTSSPGCGAQSPGWQDGPCTSLTTTQTERSRGPVVGPQPASGESGLGAVTTGWQRPAPVGSSSSGGHTRSQKGRPWRGAQAAGAGRGAQP